MLEVIIVLQPDPLHLREHMLILPQLLDRLYALLVELFSPAWPYAPHLLQTLDGLRLLVLVDEFEALDCALGDELTDLLQDTLTYTMHPFKLLSRVYGLVVSPQCSQSPSIPMSTALIVLSLIVLVKLLDLCDYLVIQRLLLPLGRALSELVPPGAPLDACKPVLAFVYVLLLLRYVVRFPLKQVGVLTQELLSIFEAFRSVSQLRAAP